MRNGEPALTLERSLEVASPAPDPEVRWAGVAAPESTAMPQARYA